jgi:hypothetical protein
VLRCRPKPPKAGEADTDAKPSPSLRPSAARNWGLRITAPIHLELLTDFFNEIDPQRTLRINGEWRL